MTKEAPIMNAVFTVICPAPDPVGSASVTDEMRVTTPLLKGGMVVGVTMPVMVVGIMLVDID